MSEPLEIAVVRRDRGCKCDLKLLDAFGCEQGCECYKCRLEVDLEAAAKEASDLRAENNWLRKAITDYLEAHDHGTEQQGAFYAAVENLRAVVAPPSAATTPLAGSSPSQESVP